MLFHICFPASAMLEELLTDSTIHSQNNYSWEQEHLKNLDRLCRVILCILIWESVCTYQASKPYILTWEKPHSTYFWVNMFQMAPFHSNHRKHLQKALRELNWLLQGILSPECLLWWMISECRISFCILSFPGSFGRWSWFVIQMSIKSRQIFILDQVIANSGNIHLNVYIIPCQGI